MASILFAGGKFNSVSFSGSISETTNSSVRNTTYADAALLLNGSGAKWWLTFRDSAAATTTISSGTLYAHAVVYFNSMTANTLLLQLNNSAGEPWLAVRAASTTTIGLYYNSGTGASPTWTLIGSAFTFTTSVLRTIDIKFTFGSPHSAELSVDGTLQASGTFTQASLTGLEQFQGNWSGGNSHYSELLVTEGISTIGAFVAYTSASGAGNSSGWTGAYTDINEAAGSDATTISAASAGLKSTFAWGNVTVPAGSVIKDVFIWSRAKNDGASPNNIKTVIRSGGTDYAGSNLAGIGTSFGPLLRRADTDPATSAQWTQTGWNAVELGAESAA